MYYEYRKRKLWSLFLMGDEIGLHAETLKSGWDLLSRLSPSTMIIDVGDVIDDQCACVAPQRVQHEFLPHSDPSSFKFWSTEFRRININLAVFLWTSRTVSTIINYYSSRTPCKLEDNWRFAFVTCICGIVASNWTLSTNNLISKFNDHVLSLTPVRC